MKKILIVEDEKSLARIMSLKLSSAGYLTTAVFGGEEALVAIQKDNFDLMILDLIMPNGDGYFVLNELKKLHGKKPIVIIASNLSQKEDIEKTKKLGAAAFFIKSESSLEEMVNIAKQYLPV